MLFRWLPDSSAMPHAKRKRLVERGDSNRVNCGGLPGVDLLIHHFNWASRQGVSSWWRKNPRAGGPGCTNWDLPAESGCPAGCDAIKSPGVLKVEVRYLSYSKKS